jgi:hypothetical protein
MEHNLDFGKWKPTLSFEKWKTTSMLGKKKTTKKIRGFGLWAMCY